MSTSSPNTSNMAVETYDLWRVYTTEGGQKVPALRGITVKLEKGNFYAVKGRSGSGKTTLLNLVGGLDTPTKGHVRIFGQDLSKMDDASIAIWRRNKLGFIFQSFGLMPTLTAYENIELILRIAGKDQKTRHLHTMEILEQVGLKKWKDHRALELSGGQQQRVAIARSLINQPLLLIADEPTGELDTSTAHEILKLLKMAAKEQNITMLISTHSALVDEYADRIFNLSDGKIQPI